MCVCVFVQTPGENLICVCVCKAERVSVEAIYDNGMEGCL